MTEVSGDTRIVLDAVRASSDNQSAALDRMAQSFGDLADEIRSMTLSNAKHYGSLDRRSVSGETEGKGNIQLLILILAILAGVASFMYAVMDGERRLANVRADHQKEEVTSLTYRLVRQEQWSSMHEAEVSKFNATQSETLRWLENRAPYDTNQTN